MNPDNGYYGHTLAFAYYCGRSSAPPVFGYVPHGWGPDLPPSSRRFTSAPMLVWNTRHLEQAETHGVVNAVCVGAPFSYLVRTLWPNDDIPDGQGTFVFPSHSAESSRIAFDIELFARNVMDASPGPYTASVYYQDLDTPQVGIYQRLGWRVVTFGSRQNPVFSTRLALEVASHAHVVSNRMQTGVLYAALMGKAARVVGPISNPNYSFGDPWNIMSCPERWPELHGEGLSREDARSLGEFELGWSEMQAPKTLERTLGWANSSRRLAARGIRLGMDLKYGRELRSGTYDDTPQAFRTGA